MSRERWLLVAGVGLYLLALGLPALEGSGFPTQSGLDVLRQGASAWRDGVVAWYANPVLWAAWLLLWLGRYRLGLAAAAAGLLLGLSSFSAATVAGLAGRSVPAFSFGAGFYVWLAAILLTAGAGMLGIYKVSAATGGEISRPDGSSRD